jgi:hypothetical protein
MVEKKKVFNDNNLILVFGAMLLFSLLMIFVENSLVREKITGYDTQVNTVSNVTIQNYLSIDMSDNLTDGITFGTVATLPAINVNATHNFDAQGAVVNQSSFYVNVSTDSNTPVDFCIKANDSLVESGGNVIGITNETYANNSLTNLTLPSSIAEEPITTTYDKATTNILQGGAEFYRFYLDVPAATAAGSYQNLIYFKGVTNGSVCGV